MTFDEFRKKHSARDAKQCKIKNDDELLLMPSEEGRLSFGEHAASNVQQSQVPRDLTDRGNVYLWAITSSEVPFALEHAKWGKKLGSGVVKHTNLTGGGKAHCGGELWFVDPNSVIVGGSSGRYGPQNEQELIDAAISFAACNYKVAYMGFDEDTGQPLTVLVGEPQWLPCNSV
jgi:hypothetical protein